MSTISKIFRTIASAIALIAVGFPTMADTLSVAVSKSEVLRLGRAVAVVMVGEPTVADVQVESPRLLVLTGKSVGETNLILLDSEGGEIARYDVLVVPEADRHVTIHHGGDGVSTLSCNPRCAGVKNPGTEAEPKGTGGSAGGTPSSQLAAPKAGAASAAPAAGGTEAAAPAAAGGPSMPAGSTSSRGY